MKKIYENFSEIADDFVDGENWTHQLSDHHSEECYSWMHGIAEFAAFLDFIGVKIIQNQEIYEKLWSRIRSHKPKEFMLIKRHRYDDKIVAKIITALTKEAE